MNNIIKTLPQLQVAQSDAWVYGAIVCLIALGLSILIAFLINWQSDRRCYVKRRIWFIIVGLILPLAYWFYNIQSVVPKISNAGFKSMFEKTNLYILITSILVYFILGIVLMFIFRYSKFGSILGKEK